ncbi:MAG: hypothetical protein GWN16_10455, partial [Calditrichae bacterium]|nr:hypothetical protein [Calditrichia bacterium]
MISPIKKLTDGIHFLIVILALFISKDSLAQSFEIRSDAISGAGGKSNSTNVEAFMAAGQSTPVG